MQNSTRSRTKLTERLNMNRDKPFLMLLNEDIIRRIQEFTSVNNLLNTCSVFKDVKRNCFIWKLTLERTRQYHRDRKFRIHLLRLVCWPAKQLLLHICCLHTLGGHTDAVWSLVVLPNGALACGSADSSSKLWSTDTRTCLHTLTGHMDMVLSLVVLPNGVLASGSADSSIKLWSMDTQACLHTLTGHTSSVISLVVLPDGVLATGSRDSSIKLWDADTQACLHALIGHTSFVYSLVVLPNGVHASGSFDSSIRLWK